jgi:hypothetical protein
MSETRTPEKIAELLAAPFPEHELCWKPRSVQGSKALAVAYLTVTAIETRLDETLGIDGWEDSYEVLPSGAVVCTLRCRFGDTWISKQDIGTPSQNDAEASATRSNAVPASLAWVDTFADWARNGSRMTPGPSDHRGAAVAGVGVAG